MAEHYPLIFVSGPLTTGDNFVAVNVRRACEAADMVWALGGMPIVPHLSMLWTFTTAAAAGRRYDLWMSWCYAQIERCDALYRFDGQSKGADLEVLYAATVGVPVYKRESGVREFVREWFEP